MYVNFKNKRETIYIKNSKRIFKSICKAREYKYSLFVFYNSWSIYSKPDSIFITEYLSDINNYAQCVPLGNSIYIEEFEKNDYNSVTNYINEIYNLAKEYESKPNC